MGYVLLGAVVLVALLGLGRLAVQADPRQLVAAVRYAVGGLLIVAGGFLALRGSIFAAVPVIGIGIAALTRGRIGGIDLGGGTRSSGRRSAVRSAFIEMTLDHDSGTMTGTVRQGTFAGRGLDGLDEADLFALRDEAAADADSLALVEAYLDRRIPGWREDGEEDVHPGPGGAADPGAMADEEAYEILGLAPGAGEAEIRAAHRRLMKGVHPDGGGSTFLAAKLNQAKDRLLRKHR